MAAAAEHYHEEHSLAWVYGVTGQAFLLPARASSLHGRELNPQTFAAAHQSVREETRAALGRGEPVVALA